MISLKVTHSRSSDSVDWAYLTKILYLQIESWKAVVPESGFWGRDELMFYPTGPQSPAFGGHFVLQKETAHYGSYTGQ